MVSFFGRSALAAAAVGGVLLFASSVTALSSCIAFDTSFNLLVFGGTNDVSLGAASSWSSPTATTITASSGRPPFTGTNTTCFLAQYSNAIYVLGADASSLSDIYIFNVASSSWSKQSTTSAPTWTNAATVLDHDTNTFFTWYGGALWQLDFSSITTAATSSALAWSTASANNQPFTSTTYQPVMALASNHINFMGVPDVAAGSADLFVIHYAYWQPSSQSYPTLNSGPSFPDSHGQATSFFLASDNAQYQFAFVPDDYSDTYIVTHWTSASATDATQDEPSGITNYINTTQTLPAPTLKDTSSVYAASDVNLVQLTSSGQLYYITALQSSSFAVPSSTWNQIGYTLSGVTGESSAISAAATASGSAAASAGASASGSAAAKTTASKSASAAAGSASAAAASASATKASAAVGAAALGKGAVAFAAGVFALAWL